MYQALYRKWRPQVFDDVIGQEHITESLKGQVQSGHLSHAYIFIGTRGTGKTTCARILAKAVNCDAPVNGNPCGVCPSCRAIAEGTATDLVEIDAASNNGVSDVRALREEAVFSPAVLKKRVYIIDEVHMLSTAAFNALLKILEEPPEHILFILATTELQKVPATILSRCQRHSFRRISPEVLSAYLMTIASREKITLSREAADLLAGLAEGGVRDSLSMLDQCSSYGTIGTEEVYNAVGLAGNVRTAELLRRITAQETERAIALFDELWRSGKDPASLLRELSSLVRDVLMLKVAPNNAAELIYGGYDRAVLREFASTLSAAQLSALLEALQMALGNMRDRLNPKMTAELCIISLCQNPAGDTLDGLRLRVAALEEAIKNGIPSSPARPMQKSPARTAPADLPPWETEAPPPFEEPPLPEEPPMNSNYAGAESYAPAAASSSASASKADEPSSVAPSRAGAPSDAVPSPASAHVSAVSVSATATPASVGASAAAPASPIPPAPAAPAAPAQQPSASAEEVWRTIIERARPHISGELKAMLDDRNLVFGRIDNGSLIIEAQKGFYYMRLGQPKTLDLFSKVATELAGMPVQARIKEMPPRPKNAPQGDLESLRAFPNVTFVE